MEADPPKEIDSSLGDLPFAPTPIAVIKARWNDLKNCDLKAATIEQLQEQIKGLTRGRVGGTGTLQPGELVYRARSFSLDKLPTLVSELGARPAALVKDLQRCNRSGESLFYCSQRQLTTFRELRKKVGDRMLLSEWEIVKPLRLVPIGYHPSVFQRLGSGKVCPDVRSRIGYAAVQCLRRVAPEMCKKTLRRGWIKKIVLWFSGRELFCWL